ncbi:MAG: alpha/beta fold hydrolase [Proteobacteria bacterium]|nr:alpha/beta fold hydrolase [Pseudomonadota bacterium]
MIPLVIVHGANGAAREMAPLTGRLPGFVPNMIGHGGREIPASLNIPAIAADLLRQCDDAGIGMADWFGFSFGGLVALWIAAYHPERVRGIVTLVTKVDYDARSIAHVTHLLDPERLADKPRGAELAETHAPQDWRELARVNARMFEGFRERPPLGDAEIARIRQPVLLMAGMEDPLVSGAETSALARRLPNATTGLFAGSCHPIAQAPLDAIVRLTTAFLAAPEQQARAARVKLTEFRWDGLGEH